MVAHREVDDLQLQPCGAEQQVEVAERVEVAEVRAAGRDLLVAAARSSAFVPQSVSLTGWPIRALKTSENALFPSRFRKRIAPGSRP